MHATPRHESSQRSFCRPDRSRSHGPLVGRSLEMVVDERRSGPLPKRTFLGDVGEHQGREGCHGRPFQDY